MSVQIEPGEPGEQKVWLALLRYFELTILKIYRKDIKIDTKEPAITGGLNLEMEEALAMRNRTEALEFSLLGILQNGDFHGYELRKQLKLIYGPFRALSFSVLYPQLKRMVELGLIEQTTAKAGYETRKLRIIYAITAAGKKHFKELAAEADPSSWDDETFNVRFAFFGPTPKKNRVEILEGRQRRLADKAAEVRSEIKKVGTVDTYVKEWGAHTLENIEREIEWLIKMLKNERGTK